MTPPSLYGDVMSHSLDQRAATLARPHMGDIAWPTVVLCAGTLAVLSVSTAAALLGWLPLWLATLAHAILLYVIFTPLHEAAHGNIHGTRQGLRWLNEAIGHVSGLVLVMPYPLFRTAHSAHHRHTNDPERDPDHWVATSHPLAILGRCMSISWSYILYTARFGARDDALYGLAYLGGVIGLVLAAAAFGVLAWVIWLWLVPALLATTVLAFAFDWLVHYPHTNQDRFQNTRIHLVDGGWQTPVALLSLWQAYHLIHHLFPRIPFYRYARAFADLRPILEAHGAPVTRWGSAHHAGK